MGAVLLMVLTFAGYIVAYHTYGRFLARKIFRLRPEAEVPSRTLTDGIDYVPTRKGIIFGHHYTSIAGTGPIVGPAIGIIWGWLPAVLWVFLGSIFMGAVHDFGVMVLSLRHQGRSVSDMAAHYFGPRIRYLFFTVVFIELLVVIAIFGLVIAVIFNMYPQSVFPVWMEIPIAMALGWFLIRKPRRIALWTTAAVILMYVTVVIGHLLPVRMPDTSLLPATGLWTVILLTYAFFASTLPVHRLLQPRDYINAWELFVTMGLLIAGVVGSGLSGTLHLVAPAHNLHAVGAPSVWPFLFITIACGAISGFHSLVSSGTSSKQISGEPDALFVGYGAMLMEAALGILVIIAVAAGIGMAYETPDGRILAGSAAWAAHYSSWEASAGLTSKISAMVIGSANMIATVSEPIGISKELAIVIMGVFIASFAGTTLDSATRIQRYVVSEVFESLKCHSMAKRYPATAFAVLTAAALAFITGADGTGALRLWPLFGATNQVLGALALLLLTIYLRRRGGLAFLITAIPWLFMSIMTIWAVIVNETRFAAEENWLLSGINGLILVLALWILTEGVLALRRLERTRPDRTA